MRARFVLVLMLVLLGVSACNLSSEPEVEDIPTPTGAATTRPIVAITNPADGSEVVLGEDVLISATAQDAQGVTRLQLIADGQIVRTVSSESPSGDTTMNALLDYEPDEEGTVTLQVIAYRNAVASDPAQITLTVREDEEQVTATSVPPANVPVINPNDPTCRVLVNVGLNLRVGPSTNYDRITVLQPGTVAPIIGRIADNSWWQLRVGTTIGWVSSDFTTEYGVCTNVAIVNPPPTPTSNAPTSTPQPTWTPLPTSNPTATATSGPADLLISNISGPETLTLDEGDTEVVGTYTITITNLGGSSTGQFTNAVTVSPGETELPLGVVASLDRNESIVLSIDIPFAAPGNYNVQARADINENVAEASEVNNVGVLDVVVSSS